MYYYNRRCCGGRQKVFSICFIEKKNCLSKKKLCSSSCFRKDHFYKVLIKSSMILVYGKFLYDWIRDIQEIILPNLKFLYLQKMLFLKLVYDVPNGRGSFKNDFKNKFRVMSHKLLFSLPNFLSRNWNFQLFLWRHQWAWSLNFFLRKSNYSHAKNNRMKS